LVREATPPLAISSASWPSSVDTGWARLRTQTHPLFDFGSPSECYPTDPSRHRRRTAWRRRLSWALVPFNACYRRGSTARGFTSPAVFRLQGLATLLAVSAPRRLVGPFSSRQRSWDSPLRSFPLQQGGRCVSAEPDPRAVSPPSSPAGEACGPVRRTPTSGLLPLPQSLAPRQRISSRGAGCSLGIRPFQGCLAGRLWRASTRTSPYVLRG
jgi:hypothetical protein